MRRDILEKKIKLGLLLVKIYKFIVIKASLVLAKGTS